MARIKRTFKCVICKKTYGKWQGFCVCGKGGTIKEITPELTPQAIESDRSKRVRRRSKDSERALAKRMALIDGEDPSYEKVASKHGRIGFITGMRADTVSSNYINENKNVRLPIWIIKAWILILQKALEFNKYPLLHLDPPNLPKEYTSVGVTRKTDTIAMIQQSRHEDLIIAERQLKQVKEIMNSEQSNVVRIRRIMEVIG